MKLRRGVAALAGAACTALTAGALIAGPAVAATAHSAISAKIAPRDGNTQTALSLSATQISFGHEDSEVLTASVNAQQQGGVPPSGKVTLFAGTTEICHFSFGSVFGHCSPTSSELTPGTYAITAFYNGDGRNNPSSSPPQNLTVVKGQTSAALSFSAGSAVFGQESSTDLTVAVGFAGTAPTGTVSIANNGNVLCTVSLPAGSNVATCQMGDTALQPGSYQLTASYSGDGNYNSAQAPAQTFDIAKDSTTTTLTLPASSLPVGQEGGARLSFRVTPATAVPGVDPTGTVTVSAGPNVICSGVLSGATGSCALATAQLQPGTYNLTATYGSDENFGDSASGPQTLTITKASAASTSTTLTLSAPRTTFGHEQAERLSVQVKPQSGGGTPTGKVTITAGSTSVCVITLSGGKGSCALGATKLRPGKSQLRASYGASPSFKASASGTKALTVAAEPTATTLQLSAAKVKVGHEQAERLSVQVKPRFSGTPAGKVTIRAGSVKVCVITLKSGKGTCTLKPSQLRAGTYHLAAAYPGASPYARSTPAKKTLTVTK